MPHDGHDHDHAHDHAHDHDHDHADDHAHAHDHAHDHDHAHAASTVAPLARHSGLGKVLYLDAPSGVAGDMWVAALVDLGVPQSVVREALQQVDLSGYHVHFAHKSHSAIVGTHFSVHVDTVQPARSHAEIRTLLGASRLPHATRDMALKVFQVLAVAEARVHRADVDSVHFHEVGGVDSIVDIVAACACVEHLGATVLVSPLPMGRGHTRSQHGIIPLPAPATLACLIGFPTYDGELAFEFVTPTGAALVAALGQAAPKYPSMQPCAIGWGAGTASLAVRPNLLRAVLGDATAVQSVGSVLHDPASGHDSAFTQLECNLDDATGELVGQAQWTPGRRQLR
jgi:pyridinium-3,5-bisthiocarboxylic acid mononucleotide nickel chelatase